jgi:hypothetical protein
MRARRLASVGQRPALGLGERRLRNSPSPMPSGFNVKNGSKSRSSCSSGTHEQSCTARDSAKVSRRENARAVGKIEELSGEGDENSSPTEVVNQLFDDSSLSNLLERGTVISMRADSMLRELSACIDAIDFDRSTGAL